MKLELCHGTPIWRDAVTFFLRDYLPRCRGASPRTLESYATALRLLLDQREIRSIGPHELDAPMVLRFLENLERNRRNSAKSRNIRLAALKSFWKAMMLWNPTHRQRYEALLAVPFKRFARRAPDYLEVDELKHLFSKVDASTPAGFRDLVILRYAYNTGCRISELAEAKMDWLMLTEQPEVTIRGKGGKWRICPLWPTTAEMLRIYMRQERHEPRPGFEQHLFITRLGTRFTRGGLWKLIRKYIRLAGATMESIRRKRLTPHSIRHTTAVHLLRARVDIYVIKAWLGHADVATTSGYLDLDMDKKREALDKFLKLDLERLTGGPPPTPLPAHVVAWLEQL